MTDRKHYYYRPTDDGNLFTVGTGHGDEWEPESDHETSGEAAARVAYLNGGGAPRELYWELVEALDRAIPYLPHQARNYTAPGPDGIMETHEECLHSCVKCIALRLTHRARMEG